MSSETFAFQAEINQLLSLIINTFYSNKEVFLRELISNASDAIDKIRYASLTSPEILGDFKDFTISIVADKEANTLTIQDTGIGMTKQDLVKNLGTIAHSGTRSFMEKLQAGSNASDQMSLIGQFGVGFYSAYLVAQNVKVTTKHNDDVQYVWESNASGSFTITEDTDGPSIGRGTKIVLELKEDQRDYLQENKIREVIKKHSEYCSFPVLLEVEREEEVPDETETKPKPEGEDKVEEGTVEEVEDDDDDKPQPPKEKKMRTVKEFTQLNTQPPIWLRKPEDVTKDEYDSFYKAISSDWDTSMVHKHFSVDGQIQFKSLLYIPKRVPWDMFSTNEKRRSNVKLYVKKVLITDDSTTILPDYLAFIQGVVDSEDLPLNVSREMLQQNSVMKIIRNNLVKKCIEMMSEIVNDEDKEKFKTFYDSFNKNIKLGVHEDRKNRTKLLELVRYYSSKSDEGMTGFKDYVSRMKEGQTKIYYITGESIKAVKSSPFIEKLRKRGLEVLYMTDPIDEYMLQTVRDYDGKEMVCCSKEGLEFEQTDEEKKAFEDLKTSWDPVCAKIKAALEDKVTSVKLSERLADNPCVLVTDKFGWSANMERIVKAQALRSTDAMGMGGSRKTLEINPDHKIMLEVKQMVETDKDIRHIVDMIFQTVLIDSGFTLDEPSKFAKQIYRLIGLGLNTEEDVDEEEQVEKEQVDDDPEPGTLMEEVD